MERKPLVFLATFFLCAPSAWSHCDPADKEMRANCPPDRLAAYAQGLDDKAKETFIGSLPDGQRREVRAAARELPPTPEKMAKLLELKEEQIKAIQQKWPGAAEDAYRRLNRMEEVRAKMVMEHVRKQGYRGLFNFQLKPEDALAFKTINEETKAVLGLGADYAAFEQDCGQKSAECVSRYRKIMEGMKASEAKLEGLEFSSDMLARMRQRFPGRQIDDAHDLFMLRGEMKGAGGGAPGGARGGGGNRQEGSAGGGGADRHAGHRAPGEDCKKTSSCDSSDVMKDVLPKHWQEYADNNSGNSGANAGAGHDSVGSGDYETAKKYYNRALETDPESAEALRGRALANYKSGDYPGAVTDSRSALRADPTDPTAMSIYKLASRQAGGADAAGATALAGGAAGAGGAGRGFLGGASAQPAVRDGDRSSYFAKQAERAMTMKDYRSVVDSASKAYELNASDARALNFRSMAYNELGQYDLALRDAVAGLKLAGKNAPLLLSKGKALLKMKDYNGALLAANEALEMDPRNAAAMAQRAYALGALGDRAAMLEALKMAAAIDPSYQASLDSALQMPKDSDVMFLFPGEDGAAAATAARKAGPSQGKRFGILGISSLAGGLLIALGMIPALKQKAESYATQRRKLASLAPAAVPAAGPNGESLIKGHYALGAEIGTGGMGLVFEGVDVSLDRKVAIKKMRPELAADAAQRRRFVAEAKTVAVLQHPNIVAIYDIVEEDADLYLVFEHVAGRTLHEILYSRGGLPLAEAVSVISGIADALEFAHARGVIHRDLKPANVMIDGEGKVKVMDFGIARTAKDALSRATMTNTVMGTPPYMAPEQEQGVVSPQVDVYALGICFYEMVTTKLPFIGTGGGMLLNKMNASYAPITEAKPGLPAALDQVMARAFAPNTSERYAGPRQFAQALENLLVKS